MENLNGIVAENGVCHKDTINGGHDVWSCENGVSSSSSAEHLVVMVHGILGRFNFFYFDLFDLIFYMIITLIYLGQT